MHEVSILCDYSRLFALVDTLQAECATRPDGSVIVLDYGSTKKIAQGFIVLSFSEQVDASLLAHLDVDPDVLDYCLYVAAPLDTDPAVLLPMSAEW